MLLKISAISIIIVEPERTGLITNSHEAPLRIITRGSAPAGGCVVFVSCIRAIANATPKAKAYH